MKIDCEKCNNNGFVLKEFISASGNIYPIAIECECYPKRKYIAAANQVGLGDSIFEKNFNSFNAQEEWQEIIKQTAEKFCSQEQERLFYIGGQIGCGKTHICTAILNALLEQGKDCRYFIWNDIVTKLKQITYEDEKRYNEVINELKGIEVLFIDDFFKNNNNTSADIDKAFQIINARYINSKTDSLITIISSEKTIKELRAIDEAIASRIYEMTGSGKYNISVNKDERKNYRFRNIE